MHCQTSHSSSEDVIPVASRKSELETAASGLVDPSWQKRVAALKAVRVALEMANYGWSGFVKFAKDSLKEQLIVQLKDSRSTVTKEACLVIRSLCKFVPPSKFEQMADWFLSPLFGMLTMPTVIAEAAGDALRALFREGKLNTRCLTSLNEKSLSKSAAVRVAVLECIISVIRAQPPSVLEKAGEINQNCIKRGLTDSSAEVRGMARVAWWAWKDVSTLNAEKIFQSCDPNLQRVIQDARQSYLDYICNHIVVPEATAKGKINCEPEPTATLQTLQPSVTPSGLALPAPVQMPSGSYQLPIGDTTRSLPESTPIMLAWESPQLFTNWQPTDVAGRQSVGRKSPPDEAPRTRERAPSPVSRNLRFSTYCALDLKESSNQLLSKLVVLSESSNWTERMQFLEDSASAAKLDDSAAPLEKVAPLICDRLNDSHYKVVIKAAATIMSLSPKYPQPFEALLERILVKIYQLYHDSKEQVRDAAKRLARHVHGQFSSPSIIFPVFLRILDTPNARVRLACVMAWNEMMERNTEDWMAMFTHGSNVRMAVHKLHHVCSNSKKEVSLEKECLSCLSQIYVGQGNHFVGAVIVSTPSVQLSLLEMMDTVAPLLKADVRNRRKAVGADGTHVSRARSSTPTQRSPQSTSPKRSLTPKASPKSAVADSPMAYSDTAPSPLALPPTALSARNCSRRGEFLKALAGVMHANVTLPGKVGWDLEKNFPDAATAIMECCKSDEAECKMLALLLVKFLFKYYPHKASYHIVHFLRPLLECCADTQRDISQHADEAIGEMIHCKGVNPLYLLDLITEEVSTASCPHVQVAVKYLRIAATNSPADELEKRVPRFIHRLCDELKNKSADVRKAVVFCFVDLYITIGDKFLPWFKPINSSQAKLIQIYIDRARQASGFPPLGTPIPYTDG